MRGTLKHWAIALMGVMLCVASTGPVAAQNVSGSLTGSVVDETGAVVPGADVTLTNDASKDVRRSKSNRDGNFTFAAVPPGSYTILVELGGFKKSERTGIRLSVGDSRSIGQVKMAVGGMAE